MNFLQLRRSLVNGFAVITLASSILLASCGGGGSSQSAGVGGTGIVAGETTGFGSIYVNGSRYDTNSSQFIVDGDSNATQDDLAVGMYVKLRVKTLDGNFTGETLEVVYDDEVQGPVAGILPACPCPGETQRTFTVFGQNVTVDETTTIFDGTSFAGLANNDVVEVSGFRTSDTDITASYVEFKELLGAGSEVELRGIVTGHNPAPPESFGIVSAPGITITTDGLTVKELEGNILDDDLYVEVKGEYQNATTILATKIEFEDDDFGDDVDDVSLQGVISEYNSTADFEIDGLPIDASGAGLTVEEENQLGNGVEVEVEGNIEGGIFVAEELELRDGESELLTTVRFIDLPGNRFQLEYPGQGDDSLGRVWINTDGQTLFEDESVANLPNFSLDQLAIGNFVKVKGIAGTGMVSAEIVKRLDPDSSKLEGAVEAFNPNSSPDTSITILGITYPIDASAEYEDNTLTRVQFFGTPLQIGDIVELEDDEPDGDADEVDFD